MLKFLFFIERELHIPMLKNIMLYIKQNNIGKIAIYSFDYIKPTATTPEFGVRFDMLNNFLGFDVEIIKNPYNYNPDFTFMADFSYHYTEGLGKIINVGHGTISKGWFFSENNISKRENCADLICVPGQIHKQLLEKQVNTEIAVTGMPKLDSVFAKNNSNTEKQNLMQEFGLDLNKKTILFAPTFNKELSILTAIDVDLRKYIANDYNIIIKLHGATDDLIKQSYKFFAENNQNVYYHSGIDISPCLILADVMITDVSSVIYEFIALGKPVILFDSPLQKKYANYNPNSLEYTYRDVGYRINDVNLIPKFIKQSFDLPLIVTDIAKKFVSVQAPKASKIVVEKTLSLLEEKTLKTPLIIKTNNPKFKQFCQSHYANKFDLIFTENNLWQMHEVIENITTENALFLNAEFSASVLLFTLLLNKFYDDANCGLACPMVVNPSKLMLENLQFYHQLNNDLFNLATSLSYSAIGSKTLLEMPANYNCFAFKPYLWKNTSKANTDKQAWLNYLIELEKNNFNAVLANDCFIYKNLNIDTEIEKLEETITEKADIFDENLDKNHPEFACLNSYFSKNYSKMLDEANLLNTANKDIYLATAYFKLEDFDNALNILIKLQKTDNQILKAEVMYLIGAIKLKQNKLVQSKRTLQASLKLNPNNPRAIIAMGSYYVYTHNLPTALNLFKQINSKSYYYANALKGAALVYFSQKEFKKAAVFFERSLAIDFDDINTLKTLFLACQQINDFRLMQKPVKAFLQKYPENEIVIEMEKKITIEPRS